MECHVFQSSRAIGDEIDSDNFTRKVLQLFSPLHCLVLDLIRHLSYKGDQRLDV